MNKNTHDDKMSRLLAKYRLKIARGNEKGCNEFVFYIDKGFYGRDWEESRLDMSEETAAPILGVIEDVIPYSYDYYYDNLPVRKYETKLIYERMQEVRLKVFENPLDPSLGKIAERIKQSDFAYDKRAGSYVKDFQKRSLILRRYDLAALYKFFMKWIHPAECVFVDFWVSGP